MLTPLFVFCFFCFFEEGKIGGGGEGGVDGGFWVRGCRVGV